jgi:tetratricopeptide (TPR) repeat protein/TolB-like protein
MSRLKRLIVEIHHRSLWQVLGIYLVGAWIGFEIIQTLTEGLGLPPWFPGLAILLLIVGLPIVIATAFVHEDAAPARPPAEAEAVEQGADAVEEPVSTRPSLPARHRRITLRNAGLSFVVALAVWGVVATVWLVANPRVGVEDAIADEAEPGIAVLPFSARGDAMEVWREGMVDLLSANLDGVPGLRSIDSRTVFARWRESVPETGEVDQATALRIAGATGAKYALLGSAVSLGGEVRLTADIYETESGSGMGQVQVQGSPDSILSLVDRLAVQSLVVTLQQVESELPEIDLASVTTSSIPALRAWLEGEVHFRHGRDLAAAAAYERALDYDTTFAFAYYRLSSAYGWAEGMSSDRAEEAREQAFRWADRLPPRQAALVRGLYAWEIGERREAARILRRLVQSYPDYADAWHELGDFYYHSGPNIPVSLDDALECLARAVELDPSFAPYRIHFIDVAFKHDPDSARIAGMMAEYKQLGSADAKGTLQQETAFDLAFGSEDRRARALQGLDTLSVLGLLPSNLLLHHRFWREREAVYLAMEKRRNRDYGNNLFFGTAQGRGLAERGFGYLDRPQTPVEARACYTLFWRQAGLPVSERRLAEMDVLTNQIDSLESSFYLNCAGAHAADRGLWEEHGRAVEALEEMSRRSIAAGGTGGTEHRYALAAQAYGLWRQGQPEAGLAVLDDVRRYDATRIIRWTLGMILTDLERWDEAIPYLRSWWWGTDSFTHYNLARAYEQTGELEKARKEYAFFVEAWQDADPELQPWVEDARRALDRLTSEG